ncbi:MAG: TlpA family protein disulfide reductase, partial [Chromatiales bacterium]|nr:TlpA family protein disulfide reductase [Chromatiales bacterium]
MRALVLLLLFSLPALADERYVELPDGLEVPVDQYAGQGSGLLLWLPSEYGIQAQHRRVAAQLAKAGTDVWLADLFAGHFLPDVASSVDAIPAGEVVGLIEAALSGTADKVYLFGHDRGARLALSGAREWQLTHPGDERLAGLILISPSLYADVSEVGKDAEYLSIVSATNLPVYLVQSEFSGFRWRLNGLRKELEKGGSDVFVRLLPGVHDAYFSLADIGPQERQALERLPELLHNAVRLLGSLGGGPRYAAALQGEVVSVVAARDDRLKPYKGDPRPPPLRLKDLGGEQYALSSLRGNVVLVNFWATWCP